jgi:hypothetical protein
MALRTSESLIYLTMIRPMLRRLARFWPEFFKQ